MRWQGFPAVVAIGLLLACTLILVILNVNDAQTRTASTRIYLQHNPSFHSYNDNYNDKLSQENDLKAEVFNQQVTVKSAKEELEAAEKLKIKAEEKKQQNEELSVLDPVAMQLHNLSDS